MATGKKHYFIEENEDGKFVVREAIGSRPVSLQDTQEEAIAAAKRLNPDDHPDIEPIRNDTAVRRDFF